RAVRAGAAAGPEVDDGLGVAGSGSRLSSVAVAGVSRAVRAVLPVRADVLGVRGAGVEAARRVARTVAGGPQAGALPSAGARRVRSGAGATPGPGPGPGPGSGSGDEGFGLGVWKNVS